MTHTYEYNDFTLANVLDQLICFKDQGIEKDYEIRIDEHTVVSRTNDLSRFELFKRLLTKFSRTVSFILYKGKSRKYDRFDLNLDNSSLDGLMTAPKKFIDTEVDKILFAERRKLKRKALKKENKQLQTQVDYLTAQNQELEKNKSGVLKEILEVVSAFAPSLSGNGNPINGDINGIKMSDILQMINKCREDWGEETFGRVLGVTMTLGENIELLHKAEQLIEHHKNNSNE